MLRESEEVQRYLSYSGRWTDYFSSAKETPADPRCFTFAESVVKGEQLLDLVGVDAAAVLADLERLGVLDRFPLLRSVPGDKRLAGLVRDVGVAVLKLVNGRRQQLGSDATAVAADALLAWGDAVPMRMG